jgi:hypothetical protein
LFVVRLFAAGCPLQEEVRAAEHDDRQRDEKFLALMGSQRN